MIHMKIANSRIINNIWVMGKSRNDIKSYVIQGDFKRVLKVQVVIKLLFIEV